MGTELRKLEEIKGYRADFITYRHKMRPHSVLYFDNVEDPAWFSNTPIPEDFKFPAIALEIPQDDRKDDPTVMTKYGRLPKVVVDNKNVLYAIYPKYVLNTQGQAFVYIFIDEDLPLNTPELRDRYGKDKRHVDFDMANSSHIIPLVPNDYELITDTLGDMDRGDYLKDKDDI